MREKEDFRANLERLNCFYPNKEMLNVSEISRFTGLDRRAIVKQWDREFVVIGNSKYISKTKIARLIS